MLTVASVQENAMTFYQFLNKYAIMEISVLFVLALLTVYRRRLSSNDEYRKKPAVVEKPSKQKSSVVVIDKGQATIQFSKFSTEVLVHIVSHLGNYDIACLMATSKKMYKDISTDSIWEQLWLQTYGAMWQHPEIRKIREARGIYWDPLLNYGPPQQGWYRFFLLFEVSYSDWLLAGYCTHTRCLVCINNSIIDVTNFIHVHPGSPETLSEASGCDATDAFNEIGHSTYAERLATTLHVWDSNSNNVPTCLCSNAHLLQNMCGHCIQEKRREASKTKRYISSELPRQLRKFPAKSKLHEHMKLNQKKVTDLASSKHKEAASNAATAENGAELHFDGFASVMPLIEAAVTTTTAAVTTSTAAVVPPGEGLDDDDSDSADTESVVTSVSSHASTESSGVYSEDMHEGIDTDGMPDVSEGITSAVFSPAKALTSILDKIKRGYVKGSLQLRGVTSRGDEDPEDDGSAPPIASYFGPSQLMVPELTGFFPCVNPQDHIGQPKAFFDPFTEEWTAWWSCCGQGHVLVEAPLPPSNPVQDAIFCK